MFLENYNTSAFNVIIAIFVQQCTNDEFLTEALRILKPNGLLIIYEPLPAERKSNIQLTYSERISKLKLSGFIVNNIERKSLDKDLESKNLLKIYDNAEDICKVLANKPSFEVNYVLISFIHFIFILFVLYFIQERKNFFYTFFLNNLGGF